MHEVRDTIPGGGVRTYLLTVHKADTNAETRCVVRKYRRTELEI